MLFISLFILALKPGEAAEVFPVATNAGLVEMAGGIAFDGTNYLVGLVSGQNIASQRVSGTGELLGAQVVIGANPGFPPAVAMASARTNRLVVWSDYSISSGVTMFGQLLSPAGAKIGASFPLLANRGSHGFQALEAVASDGTNFVAVWRDEANSSYYGQVVTASGTLSGAEFPLFTSGGGSGGRNTALVYGKTNYLAVWQSGGNNQSQTYCQLISPAGVAGGAFLVSQTSSLDRNPTAAAFDGTNFLVVWNRSQQTAPAGWPVWNLCGRVVSPSGALLGNEFVVMTEQSLLPALAFDGVNYLLAWGYNSNTTNADKTIHARYLDRSGNACGPVITPFSAQGNNPPLIPLNGLLFDGHRYVLAATFGSFVVDGTGNVVGFSGGDVYATTLPRSMKPPQFVGSSVNGSLFELQLALVPGQTYTIEISTNLPIWTAVDTLSSDSTNVIPIVDPRGVMSFERMFYRVAIGNTLGLSSKFFFMEFASAGSFGGNLTPSVSFPVSLDAYSAAFDVQNDAPFPPATNVFFTGPAGSGLTNAAADPNNSNLGGTEGFYQSPNVFNPAAGPGGTWTVNYRGTNITFTVPASQAASRLVVPLPTVTVSGDTLQSVSWVYRDAATGAVFGSPPAYLASLQVEVEGYTGGRVYDSPPLSSNTTSHTLTSPVSWSNVSSINMAYDDSLGNHYVIFYSKP